MELPLKLLIPLASDPVSFRKTALHAQLEALEENDPEFAAKLQQVIDSKPRVLQFDYE